MTPKNEIENEITNAIEEVNATTEAKVTATEDKGERILQLLESLKKAKAEKDEKGGKKIRRQLRKMGYYISKMK